MTLQAEHLALLFRCRVIVSKQVENAVDRQKHHFLHGAVSGCKRLLGGHPWADHDIPKHAFHHGSAVSWAQFVHGEAHYVSRSFKVHPAHVQLGDRIGVDKHDGQVGLRADAHLVHHPYAEIGEHLAVDLPDGFVGYFDAHSAFLSICSSVCLDVVLLAMCRLWSPAMAACRS